MSYNHNDFWDRYREYKRETLEVHDSLWRSCLGFAHSRARPAFQQLVDLGAGPDALSEENLALNPSRYYSLPRTAVDPLLPDGPQTRCLSYQELRQSPTRLNVENALVTSFFSADVVQSKVDAFRTFRSLFKQGALAAITSGFYYDGRGDENPIKEAGGLTSYQTLFLPEEAPLEVFRCTARVPSALFGHDVIEVWRVLFPKG